MASFESRLVAVENAVRERESWLEARIVVLEQTILTLVQASNESSSPEMVSLSWPVVESSEPSQMLRDIQLSNQEVDAQMEEMNEGLQQMDEKIERVSKRMAELEEDSEIVNRRVVTKTTSSRQDFQYLHDTIRGMQHRVEKVAKGAKKAIAHASAVAAHVTRLIPRIDEHDNLIDGITNSNEDVRELVNELEGVVGTLEHRLRRLMHNPQPVVLPADTSRNTRWNLMQHGIRREMNLIIHRMMREGVRRRSVVLNITAQNVPQP